MTPTTRAIRVAIVEDNPNYRSSLETFFRHVDAFTLVDSFGSAESILSSAQRACDAGGPAPWDLIVMDLELPRLNGVEATRRLKSMHPETAVVVLTVFENPSVILEAISAGADGYLLKKASSRELREQLQGIAEGRAPLTGRVARTVLELVRGLSSPPSAATSGPRRLELTEREQDVLRCLVRGRTYRQAADDLGISHDTVRSHVKSVYKKLQVHSIAEAVHRAVREDLV